MEKLHICPLPKPLVTLLEERHRLGGELGPEGIKIWTDLMPSLIRTQFQFKALASHESLEEIGRLLGETLDRMQKTIQDKEKLSEFTADCFRSYKLMDDYIKTRAELNVTMMPAVDGLIHAISAHLRGNLHEKAIDAYAGQAKRAIDEFVELFKNASQTMEKETQQAFLMGIDSFTAAFRHLADKNPESLKKARIDLKHGAELLQHLGKWQEDYLDTQKSPVPVVGELVRQMLTELSENGQLSPERLHDWVEDKFWGLQEYWARMRHDLFMPRAQKDRTVARFDSLMLSLRDLDQVAPAVQQQLLRNTETQFEELSRLGFNLKLLKRHPAAWLVDLFIAILAGGVPEYKIRSTIEDFQDTDYHAYAVSLVRFLDEKDRDYLLDGLANIQKECDDRLSAAEMTDDTP